MSLSIQCFGEQKRESGAIFYNPVGQNGQIIGQDKESSLGRFKPKLLVRSKSDSELKYMQYTPLFPLSHEDSLKFKKITPVIKGEESESKQKRGSVEPSIPKTSNVEESSKCDNEHGTYVASTRPKAKSPSYKINPGREIYESTDGLNKGLYAFLAPYFDDLSCVGVFLAQNKEILNVKDFAERSFRIEYLNDSDHPLEAFTAPISDIIKKVTWQSNRFPHVSSRFNHYNLLMRSPGKLRIRQFTFSLFSNEGTKIIRSSWTGAVKKIDSSFSCSSKNFILLHEIDGTIVYPSIAVSLPQIVDQTNPSKDSSQLQEKREGNTEFVYPISQVVFDPIDDDRVSWPCTSLQKLHEPTNIFDMFVTQGQKTSGEESRVGPIAFDPIDDDQVNWPCILHEPINIFDMFATQGQVTSNKENFITEEDVSRIASMKTLSKNPLFRCEDGREFYNSKVTIAELYNFFAPHFERLETSGVFVVERRTDFYNLKEYKGLCFTAVYFKEKDQTITDSALTLIGMFKKIGSPSFWCHPVDTYTGVDQGAKNQKNKEIAEMVNGLVRPVIENWGFKGYCVGNVKEFDPNSEYTTFVLLYNKEKKTNE